ncbi:MAG: hypothetical protein ACRDQZ_22450, partial [Mycobacteriales bacterium]
MSEMLDREHHRQGGERGESPAPRAWRGHGKVGEYFLSAPRRGWVARPHCLGGRGVGAAGDQPSLANPVRDAGVVAQVGRAVEAAQPGEFRAAGQEGDRAVEVVDEDDRASGADRPQVGRGHQSLGREGHEDIGSLGSWLHSTGDVVSIVRSHT